MASAVAVWVNVIYLLQLAAFGMSMDNYSCCIANYLSLNISHCLETNSYSVLSNILHCDSETGLLLLNDDCVTNNETTGLTEFGQCFYNYGRGHNSYLTLPTNASKLTPHTCNKYNRSGTLCGKCKDGHYPLAYSFNMNCVECPNGKSNWWKFMLAAFLPLTVFYFLILFFKINITSSYLQGFVLYCQVLTMPIMVRVVLIAITNKYILNGYKFYAMFCGIWNLDMLRSWDLGICLEITSLQTILLDLAIGVYPLLLMILTYTSIKLHDRNTRPLIYFWKPFKVVFSVFGRNLNMRTSLIDAFTTFFFLSNYKILSASFDLLVPVKIHQINSTGHMTHAWRLYYDATVPYFGETHLPYAILAVAFCALLVLLPTLLLILYPSRWFQKFLNLFPFRWYILHTFMDTFQGCYKNGTEPETHDYRCFSSIFFVLRFLLALIASLTLGGQEYFTIASLVLVITALFLVQFQPYKEGFGNLTSINITFCLFLSVFHTCILGSFLSDSLAYYFDIIVALALAVVIVYITVIILHWIYRHRNFGLGLFRRVKARLNGYTVLS